MPFNFPETYSRMTDEELLYVAQEQESLLDKAKEALAAELSKRGLHPDAAGGQSELARQLATGERTYRELPRQLRPGSQEIFHSPEPDGKYRGIHGWLQVVVLYLIIVSPLGLAQAFPQWRADKSVPYDPYFPWFPWAIFAARSIGILMAALGLYAGISMWRNWPGAVRLAKLYFLSMGCEWLALLAFFRFRRFHNQGPSDLVQLAGMVLNFIGYLYLIKSKRVAATFRPNA